MRMWMVPVERMCRKHLLGEHVEHHMFLGTLRKNKRFDGYFKNNLFEPRSLLARHDEIVKEMKARGYNHNSPLELNEDDLEKLNNLPDKKVDKFLAMHDLLTRCPDCRARGALIFKAEKHTSLADAVSC